MKMVKSLLLGSAAGIVAVAGAQAADLPVKAKPVEYVKVCSLYGAGFYYMPGTDICIKIGGYVRFQAYYNAGNNGTNGAFYGQGGFETATFGLSNDFLYRTRAVITADTRQQTEYGTLRTYTLIGFQHDGPGVAGSGIGINETLYAKRGFIQLAGFTFGKAQSFFDIWSIAANTYFAVPSSDTGDPGQMLAAYTAQFGNGFTGTIALEDPRRTIVGNLAGPTGFGNLTTAGLSPSQYNYGNVKWPDIVGVLRVDQAWGSAQVMAAIHDVDANYYPGNAAAASATVNNGHATDKIGWAVGAGAIIKTDFISPGDNFSFQVNYTEGALRYLDLTPGGTGGPYYFGGGNSFGQVLYTDGVFTSNAAAPLLGQSGIELTKGFGVNASYDHRWNERWKTSIYGGWLGVFYSDQAKAMFNGTAPGLGGGICPAAAVPGSNFIVTPGAGLCDPDGSQWWIGSRTQFNINSSTYLGLDVMYRRIDSSFSGSTLRSSQIGPRPAQDYIYQDQEAVQATFRIHRDFLP